MAGNHNVKVLFSTGVPIVIKATPDTPILQILNEACMKKNVNPDEHDLKYQQKILDVNSTIRYNKISNNGRVEVVKSNKPRVQTNVSIRVQLENGDRKDGQFSPDLNVQQLLKNLNIDYNAETAVVIYLKKEISGKDFEAVTLLSLGLSSGSALLRLVNKDPERSREQAHVYTPSNPKVSKVEVETKVEEKRDPPAKPPSPPPAKPQQNNDFEYVSPSVPPVEPQKDEGFDSASPSVSSVKPLRNKVFNPVSFIKSEKGITQKQSKSENKKKVSEEDRAVNMTEAENKKDEKSVQDEAGDAKAAVEKESVEKPKIYYLDKERKALLFNQALAKKVTQVEMPDEFYEVTDHDSRLYQKRLQEKVKECPLMTQKLRDLEKDKFILTNLGKYPKTVIKIHFDSQLVLQGVFSSVEQVASLKDFVRTYLEDPTIDFSLFTRANHYCLNEEKTLVEENLAPGAILQFSGKSDIHPKFIEKLTDPSAALDEANARLSNTPVS